MMRSKLQLLVLVIILHQFSYGISQKLRLTVFYASKCPDSRTFILKQLQPAFHLLHDYVQLKFVPFGKARSINYGDEGFECQHGSAECLGNIVHDCALQQLKAQSDKKKLAYVACEIEFLAGSMGSFDCIEKSGLSTQLVEQCVVSGEGTILQLESEYYTSLIEPKFVPSITINDEFNQEIQNNGQIDLIGTLCSVLSEVPPCARYYNYIALHHVLNKRPHYTQ